MFLTVAAIIEGYRRRRGVRLPSFSHLLPSDTMADRLNVAIVGLGFGAEFIPIYQRHPDAEMYAICQRNKKSLNEIGDQFGVEGRYTSFVSSIRDGRKPVGHAAEAANWTMTGICAHESAMRGGERIRIPSVEKTMAA